MLRQLTVNILIFFSLFLAVPARAGDSTIFTLWPLVDYRASAEASYSSLHLLGPFARLETKGDEVEYSLRPFLHRAVDDAGSTQTEVLYPLVNAHSRQDAIYIDVLHLLNFDFGPREQGSSNQFYLFPLLFYGDEPETGRYAAFFPFGGTLHGWFGRDRVSFALFPLYGHTEQGKTRTDNVLWPIFSLTRGERESGFDIWPIYGQHVREGVFDKKYYLWPLIFDEKLDLDSNNPVTRFAVLPFWFEQESRTYSQRSVLWPFLNWTQDRSGDYEQWDAPWPIVRVTTGSTRHGLRLLPFYADETVNALRKRWFIWPIYKIEDISTEMLVSQRHRVLFFLYSDLLERKLDTGEEQRRIDFWPLFSYHRENGVSRLNALALLDSFYPGNEPIARSWSPLWRVYQQRWDGHGNLVISLLWNLYWQERQGDRLAFELFPIIEYRRENKVTALSLLKGLVKIRNEAERSCLALAFLPWESCSQSSSTAASAVSMAKDEVP